MRRTVRAGVLVLVLALGLSGCFKLEASYTVRGDETVDLHVVLGLSRELLSVMEARDGSRGVERPDDVLRRVRHQARSDLPEGATIHRWSNDAFRGLEITAQDVPIDEVGGEQGVRITHDPASGEYRFVLDTRSVWGSGAERGGAARLADTADMDISVAFPGEVLRANGDATVEGNRVMWSDVLEGDHPRRLRAVGADSAAGWPVPAVVGGVVLAGLAVLAALVLLLRRRRSGLRHSPAARQD